MSRTLRLRATLAALVLVSAGCIDFVEPAPPQNPGGTPFVSLNLMLQDTVPPSGARTLLQLSGRFTPGTDSLGEPLPVVTDTFRVLGRSFAPSQVERGGGRNYFGGEAATLPSLNPTGGVLPVELPQLQGRAWLAPVRLVVWGRSDPDTLLAARGARLSFRLARPNEPLRAARVDWQLELQGGINIVTIRRNSAPPNLINVAADQVPNTPDGLVRARLTVTQSFNAEFRGPAVVVTNATQTLRWVVRVVAVAGSARAGS